MSKKEYFSVEVRNEPELSKKIDILVEKGISQSSALKHFRVDRSTYSREKKALQHGKEPHRNGRPRALTEEEKQKLIDWIQDQNQNKNSQTKKMVAEKVCISDVECFLIQLCRLVN